MRSAFALSVLALSAAHGAMAAPVTSQETGSQTVPKSEVVESAKDIEATLMTAVKHAADAIVSALPEDPQGMADWWEVESYAVPPPIFDPPEPRPKSIFVDIETGDVMEDELPPPPVISFSRPEVLSKFDAGNQPLNTPFPPDQETQYESLRLMHCQGWFQTAKLTMALLTLFATAALMVKLIEVGCARMFSRRARNVEPQGILRVETFFDDEKERLHSRSQSLSPASTRSSRSSSFVKLSEYEA